MDQVNNCNFLYFTNPTYNMLISVFWFTYFVDEIQELTLEADLSLQLVSFGKDLLFDLNRLAIFSQHLHRNMLNQTRESLMPHFHSNTAVALSSRSRSGEHILASQVSRSTPTGLGDAHSTNLPAPGQEILVETSGFSPLYHGNYILKHLAASIKIEKMVLGTEVGFGQVQSVWFGRGSISGFDATIAISEIQVYSVHFFLSFLSISLTECFGNLFKGLQRCGLLLLV